MSLRSLIFFSVVIWSPNILDKDGRNWYVWIKADLAAEFLQALLKTSTQYQLKWDLGSILLISSYKLTKNSEAILVWGSNMLRSIVTLRAYKTNLLWKLQEAGLIAYL